MILGVEVSMSGVAMSCGGMEYFWNSISSGVKILPSTHWSYSSKETNFISWVRSTWGVSPNSSSTSSQGAEKILGMNMREYTYFSRPGREEYHYKPWYIYYTHSVQQCPKTVGIMFLVENSNPSLWENNAGRIVFLHYEGIPWLRAWMGCTQCNSGSTKWFIRGWGVYTYLSWIQMHASGNRDCGVVSEHCRRVWG